MTREKPEHLCHSKLCPRPRGEQTGCPGYKNRDACVAFRRKADDPSRNACEKRADIPASR